MTSRDPGEGAGCFAELRCTIALAVSPSSTIRAHFSHKPLCFLNHRVKGRHYNSISV